MKEQDLQSAAKISAMTIAKLGRNKNVNTEKEKMHRFGVRHMRCHGICAKYR